MEAAARSLVAAIVGWQLCGLLAARAAETASAGYRVDGTVTPAAGGGLGCASYGLYHLLGQPEPLGEASAPGQTILHGWRIPPIAVQLYRYDLEAGWSLRGSPGVSDQAIGPIFTGIAGAPIKVGNILYAGIDGSFVPAADSDPLIELRAFWVFSYWGGSGQTFTATDAPTPGAGTSWLDLLQPGWNLFSPPYVVTVPPRSSSGIVVVWRWDPTSAAYEVVLPGRNLVPLEGYWVFVAAAAP